MNLSNYGFVVIGRNEGGRLRRCLASVIGAAPVVYVDSGSTDGSQDWARSTGVELVELDTSIPFTAARARNEGFAQLKLVRPNVQFIQFVDGDCILHAGWITHALEFLKVHGDAAVVFGRRAELFPEQSVYNWLCDKEWDGQAGEEPSFGGDAMIRVSALTQVGGYREDLIAGEEPELSIRLRGAGWRIYRLPAKMTFHDANITAFVQWWRRTVRSGYAFAKGASLHGRLSENHFVWERNRALLWSLAAPLACALCLFWLGAWGLCALIIFPAQIARQTLRNTGTLKERIQLAAFQMMSRFGEAYGIMMFGREKLTRKRVGLIEYKK